MSLTSKEVNYLIWRYLQESGFELAAYALDQQSQCSEYGTESIKTKIKPGCLINLIQKGILYSIAESEAKGDDESSYTFLATLIKEDLENIADEEVEQEQKDERNGEHIEPSLLDPSLKFPSSLTSDWYETKIAYGNDSVVVIINDQDIILNHMNVVNLIRWSPQGTLITCSGSELRVWSPDGKLKNLSTLESGIITDLAWSESEKYLMVLDTTNRVSILDSMTLSLVKHMNSETNIVATWLSDDKFAVTTQQNNIKIFDSEFNPIGLLNGHENSISLLKFDRQTKLLASCSDTDYSIKLWSSSSSCLDLVGKKHNSPLIELEWNNGLLYSVSIEGILNIWNEQGQNVNSSRLTTDLIYCCKVSPNGKHIVIGDDQGKVSIFDDHLKCTQTYQPEMKENAGICEIKWNNESTSILCSYNAIESVVLNI